MSPAVNQAPSPSYWSQTEFLFPLISLQLPGCESQTQSHLDLIFFPSVGCEVEKETQQRDWGVSKFLNPAWPWVVMLPCPSVTVCTCSVSAKHLQGLPEEGFPGSWGWGELSGGVMSCQKVLASQAYGKGKRVLKQVQSPRRSRRNVKHVIGKSWACLEPVKWKVAMKGKK